MMSTSGPAKGSSPAPRLPGSSATRERLLVLERTRELAPLYCAQIERFLELLKTLGVSRSPYPPASGQSRGTRSISRTSTRAVRGAPEIMKSRKRYCRSLPPLCSSLLPLRTVLLPLCSSLLPLCR